MSDLLKRIANYFANEYNGDDKTAPKMELSVDELRYIASMHVDKCRAEAELRELKNKRYPRTNADRIRSMSDEELEELFYSFHNLEDKVQFCKNKTECDEILDDGKEIPDNMCKKCLVEWLQEEVEG